ncbi:CWF19-like protein 2 homolog [Leptinotarsa decemlineata]|uniref:CWF19-like protein 2 homolog n=1 Tax=Leptinotarsa decemlineata TaxID=7539 RepID=UPI003D30A2B2
MGKHKRKHKNKKHHDSSSEGEWVEKKIRKDSTSDDESTIRKKSKLKYSHRSSSEEKSSTSDEMISKEERSHKRCHKSKSKRDRSSSEDSYSSASSRDEVTMKRKHKFTSEKKNFSRPSRNSCTTLSSGDEAYSEEKLKSTKDIHRQFENSTTKKKTSARDEWMNLPTSFSSFSNFDRKTERGTEKNLEKEKQQYNPRECGRELNFYWKNGGNGLPSFVKPEDSDGDQKSYTTHIKDKSRISNWRKKKIEPELPIDPSENKTKQCTDDNSAEHNVVTSEKDLNVLASKLVKAEIMGNTKLVAELKEKLERARNEVKDRSTNSREEHVILTHTDSQGRSQPLTLQAEYEELSSKKGKKKRVETHEGGQRVRYFSNDDKYSLKQMFESEKYNSVEDQNKEFLKMTSKIGKNDDLDDIFTDNIRNAESSSKVDTRNRDKAVHNHATLSKSLDNCDKCIQSQVMLKHLMISMGETAYLALPAHEPLSTGHCMIVPIRHVPCSTQLDENEWSDIIDLRRSITQLFKANNEEVIFFETAMKFHKYPHMVIECIPLPKEDGDMAPIYFKKAIDESEYEWSQNKKLVSLKGRDIRKAVPKGLPYFSVSFGMEEGFAHVIEDEQYFPSNFAQEIIGGMLDLHHSKWRKPKKQNFDEQSERVLKFSKEWKNFDCTV